MSLGIITTKIYLELLGMINQFQCLKYEYNIIPKTILDGISNKKPPLPHTISKPTQLKLTQ